MICEPLKGGSHRAAPQRIRRGLSLLELLVVIAIMLILASLILGVGMGLYRAAQALTGK